MLNLFKSKDRTSELVDQVIGGQSVLLRIFRETFEEDPEEVQKMELTYVALSVFTYTFLRLSSLTEEEKEATTDHVAAIVLKKSIPYAEKEISADDAVNEYQQRHREYNSLINNIFKESGIDSDSCTTLMIHVYECVMGKLAKDKMIKITLASSLMAQYIIDHVDFIKSKKF